MKTKHLEIHHALNYKKIYISSFVIHVQDFNEIIVIKLTSIPSKRHDRKHISELIMGGGGGNDDL